MGWRRADGSRVPLGNRPAWARGSGAPRQAGAALGFGSAGRTSPFFGNGRASVGRGFQPAQNETRSPFAYRPNVGDQPMVVAPELSAVPFAVAVGAMRGHSNMKLRGATKKAAIINAKRRRG